MAPPRSVVYPHVPNGKVAALMRHSPCGRKLVAGWDGMGREETDLKLLPTGIGHTGNDREGRYVSKWQ